LHRVVMKKAHIYNNRSCSFAKRCRKL